MPRLNYVPVLERPSYTPIYRNGWRSIKPKPYDKLAIGVGAVAVLAARRRLDDNVKPWAPAATPQEPLVRMNVDTARRHPKILADMLKARSTWSSCAFPILLVLKSASISPRKPKAHEESTESTIPPPAAAHTKTEKARTHLLASPAPISSKSRTRETEESRLTTWPIITANMKLDDMLWPTDIAQATAAIDLSVPMLIAVRNIFEPAYQELPTCKPLQATGEFQRHHSHHVRG